MSGPPGEGADNSMEPILFRSVELLSLYTTMMLKRYVVTGVPLREHLPYLVKVVEGNLLQLGVDKKQFFSTVRDHTRRYHREWMMGNKMLKGQHTAGQRRFNTYLMLLGLHSGLEELIPPDGGAPVYNELLKQELSSFSSSEPVLALKILSQVCPNYEYLACHSPNLEELHMPLNTPASFEACMAFRNLRVIQFAGGVSDKQICSALWNVSKKSEKVLEIALKESKKPDSWELSLPHLEELRSIHVQTRGSPMNVCVGAIALLIQPKMQVVECMVDWNTFTAITHLLDSQRTHQKGNKVRDKLAVSQLAIPEDASVSQVKQVVQVCPRLHFLTLSSTIFCGMEDSMSIMLQLLPLENISELCLNIVEMTPEQFVVFLPCMKKLDKLTLHVTPDSIHYMHEKVPQSLMVMSAPMSAPSVTQLRLVFVTDEVNYPFIGNKYHMEDLINFMTPFRHLREVSFCNTKSVRPKYLIYACVMATLLSVVGLDHLGINYYSYHPCNVLDQIPFSPHPEISNELASALGTSEALFKLKSMEIDECFLTPAIDSVIESMRMRGVLVSVRYNWLVNK